MTAFFATRERSLENYHLLLRAHALTGTLDSAREVRARRARRPQRAHAAALRRCGPRSSARAGSRRRRRTTASCFATARTLMRPLRCWSQCVPAAWSASRPPTAISSECVPRSAASGRCVELQLRSGGAERGWVGDDCSLGRGTTRAGADGHAACARRSARRRATSNARWACCPCSRGTRTRRTWCVRTRNAFALGAAANWPRAGRSCTPRSSTKCSARESTTARWRRSTCAALGPRGDGAVLMPSPAPACVAGDEAQRRGARPDLLQSHDAGGGAGAVVTALRCVCIARTATPLRVSGTAARGGESPAVLRRGREAGR
jgi:hypothetical protein